MGSVVCCVGILRTILIRRYYHDDVHKGSAIIENVAINVCFKLSLYIFPVFPIYSMHGRHSVNPVNYISASVSTLKNGKEELSISYLYEKADSVRKFSCEECVHDFYWGAG